MFGNTIVINVEGRSLLDLFKLSFLFSLAVHLSVRCLSIHNAFDHSPLDLFYPDRVTGTHTVTKRIYIINILNPG